MLPVRNARCINRLQELFLEELLREVTGYRDHVEAFTLAGSQLGDHLIKLAVVLRDDLDAGLLGKGIDEPGVGIDGVRQESQAAILSACSARSEQRTGGCQASGSHDLQDVAAVHSTPG